MKVTTIDGGFRGRRGVAGGAAAQTTSSSGITSEQQISELESFNHRLGDYMAVREMLVDKISRAQIRGDDAELLRRAMDSLDDRIDAHAAALSQVQNAEGLMAWRGAAGVLVTAAQNFATRVRSAIGEEGALRPWKIVLALVLGGAVLGTAAWWLAQVK